MERGQRTRGASSGDGVRVLREEYPYMLNSMTNLAATCWIQRRWNEAEELFIQVIEISESVGARTILIHNGIISTWVPKTNQCVSSVTIVRV